MRTTLIIAASLFIAGAAAAQTPMPAASGTVPAGTGSTAAPAADSPGTAKPVSAVKLSPQDAHFADFIGSAGLAEVQEARLAAEKAASPKVRDFAHTMIADHTAANQQLDTILRHKGLPAPRLAPKDEKQINAVQDALGTKFDHVYMDDQAHDHAAVLQALQQETRNGRDPALKSFAEQLIPVIQKHIELLKTDRPS